MYTNVEFWFDRVSSYIKWHIKFLTERKSKCSVCSLFFLISKLFLLPGYMAGNIPPIGNAEEKKNKNGQGI